MNIIANLFACAAFAHHMAWCDATELFYDGTPKQMLEAYNRKTILERWSEFANH